MYTVLEYNHKHKISPTVPHSTLESTRVQDRSITEIETSLYPNTLDLKIL